MRVSAAELHPAENRGYRELSASARQLAEHWTALADRLPAGPAPTALAQGAAAAERMLVELEPAIAAYGLHNRPAAQGLGATVATARQQLRDRSLERGQAVRLAVLDVQHLTTLLLYLASVADTRADETLGGFCRRWERSLRRVENGVRKAAAELGSDPDGALVPLDESPVGRAAHSAATAVGSLGEWIDRKRAERSGGA